MSAHNNHKKHPLVGDEHAVGRGTVVAHVGDERAVASAQQAGLHRACAQNGLLARHRPPESSLIATSEKLNPSE